MIVWRIDDSSPLLQTFIESCKQEEKGRRADVHPGLGGNLNQGPPEWQPCNLTSYLHTTHRNWMRVDVIIYQYIFKKLICTVSWKLGYFQDVHNILGFLNSCIFVVYLVRKCKQQISRWELKYQYKFTYVSNQGKHYFLSLLLLSIQFNSIVFYF